MGVGPGQAIGNGFPFCEAPAEFVHGHWMFDLDAGLHGIAAETAGTTGLTALIAMTVPSARALTITLTDGHRLHVRTHPLPAGLHRAARVAWYLTHNGTGALDYRRIDAYSASGRLVGH